VCVRSFLCLSACVSCGVFVGACVYVACVWFLPLSTPLSPTPVSSKDDGAL